MNDTNYQVDNIVSKKFQVMIKLKQSEALPPMILNIAKKKLYKKCKKPVIV